MPLSSITQSHNQYYWSSNTSVYTTFLVTGSVDLESQIAFILLTEVARETAT